MKLAASIAATVAFVSLFEPILSDDRLAKMTPDPSHEYPSIQYEKPKCGPGEVAKYSYWVGYRCVKKINHISSATEQKLESAKGCARKLVSQRCVDS